MNYFLQFFCHHLYNCCSYFFTRTFPFTLLMSSVLTTYFYIFAVLFSLIIYLLSFNILKIKQNEQPREEKIAQNLVDAAFLL